MAKKTKSKSKSNQKSKPKTKSSPKVKSKLMSKPAKKAAPKAASKPIAKSAVKASLKSGQTQTPKFSAARSIGSAVRFQPLDDRIVIERVIAPEKTAGGLFIPDAAQEKPTVGVVVAVGRGHRDAKGRTRPCDVKVGDRVLFTAWSGSEIEIKVNGKDSKFVVLRETDLLGVTTV